MSKSINILCATDKNFVPYCGIMLTSLFENNKNNNIKVYLLVDDTVAAKDKKMFDKLAEKYGQTINLVFVDGSRFVKYPVYNKQWNNSIYYRLLAAELLPESVDKVIYLDCDIVVTGDIAEMWNIDIDDYAVGVVPEALAYQKDTYDRLGLKYDGLYFNSGSMILNLRYWRGNDLPHKFLQYIKENFDKLWFNDQDTLNGVLYEQKYMLPVTYNFQIIFLKKCVYEAIDTSVRNQVDEIVEPLVIHYNASVKPWMITYYNMPYLKQWRFYRNISFWKSTPNKYPKTKALNWAIKRYILWPLHIMKKDDFINR